MLEDLFVARRMLSTDLNEAREPFGADANVQMLFFCSTNWPAYMYAGMRAYPDPYGPLVGFLFFVVLQVVQPMIRVASHLFAVFSTGTFAGFFLIYTIRGTGTRNAGSFKSLAGCGTIHF
jgi:hypothetical protein